ncbi:serine hydrolase, partial [Ferruginibacter sp.]
MKKIFLLATIIILQIQFATAQKIIPLTTPEAAGFSTERLQRLDREMNDWAKKEWMQGGVALIIRNGKIAYYKAAGVNDMDTKSALQKNAIFRIASQTKAITSVAMMMLFEEG